MPIEQKFYIDKRLTKEGEVQTVPVWKGKDLKGGTTEQVGENIIEAGRQKMPVTVVYKSIEGKIFKRTIEPLQVKAHGNKIQLYAHCRLHHETHSFVLKDILWTKIHPKLQWESPYRWKSG